MKKLSSDTVSDSLLCKSEPFVCLLFIRDRLPQPTVLQMSYVQVTDFNLMNTLVT